MVLGRVHLSTVALSNTSRNASPTDLPVDISQIVLTGLPYPVPGLMVALDALGALGNFLVLGVLLGHRALHSPFNLYLVNLLASNGLHNALSCPQHVVNYFLETWPWGDLSCTVALAVLWSSGSVVRYAHTAITLNRLWAMFAPISYRNHHHYRCALACCTGTWLLGVGLSLPGVVLDHLYYRLPPEEFGCSTNLDEPVMRRALFPVSVMATVSLLIVIAAYPCIWYKRRQLRAVKVHTGHWHTSPPSAQAIVPSSHSAAVAVRSERQSHSFLVLTLLTVSVTLAWGPEALYYILVWGLPQLVTSKPAVIVVSLISQCQALADPLLIVAAFTQLCAAFKAVVLCTAVHQASR